MSQVLQLSGANLAGKSGLGEERRRCRQACAAIGGNLYQELRNIRNVEFKFGNKDYYETVE